MCVVPRALILTALLVIGTGLAASQALSVLHIRVVLAGDDQRSTPVARHALLISDVPPSAAPRRIVTSAEGTFQVTLRPGVYAVESDKPIAFNGRLYQWTQMVEIVAGRDARLELTADNAEVTLATAEAPGEATPSSKGSTVLLSRWQDSVVTLWTPLARASGTVVGTQGLIATTRRALGEATAVEVQLTPAIKVAAQVVVSDTARDVAILSINPAVVASAPPAPLDCATAAASAITEGQALVAIDTPARGQKSLATGNARELKPHLVADFVLDAGAAGGPVLTAGGDVVGLTTPVDERDGAARGDVRVVRLADVCAALGSAEGKLNGVTPPSDARLPIEPVAAFPSAAIDTAAQRRAGVAIPYQMSSSDFDVSFITPVLARAAERRWQQTGGRNLGTGRPGALDAAGERMRLLTDFGTWSDYFEEFPPVLLVRVTPKLVEGFWTKVARGAASTQGMALPPMKRLTSGFSRLRAYCGSAEVMPIHPFLIAHRVSDTESIHEGMYVFDPDALGPQCGSVTLVLHSARQPEKGDSRTVDPKILQYIQDDFSTYPRGK
jgi:hypothetical protein